MTSSSLHGESTIIFRVGWPGFSGWLCFRRIKQTIRMCVCVSVTLASMYTDDSFQGRVFAIIAARDEFGWGNERVGRWTDGAKHDDFNSSLLTLNMSAGCLPSEPIGAVNASVHD